MNKYNIYRLYKKKEIINIMFDCIFCDACSLLLRQLWASVENSCFYFERVHYCGGSIVSKLGYDGEGPMDIE